jgi:hypothetical protein
VHGKPRIKLPLTEEAPLSTTKSDRMWLLTKVLLGERAQNTDCEP